MAAVDLYWLPLGAGGHSVRLNGRVYEWFLARRAQRPVAALFHTALVVSLTEASFVVEVGPVGGRLSHGVVAQGPVGIRAAGRFRLFRYELRAWRDGVIADVDEAVESPLRVSSEPSIARAVLELVGTAPMHVWGRDELGTGDMWNSNSVISWLLHSAGVDTDEIEPPAGGRAPGWSAGVVLARRASA